MQTVYTKLHILSDFLIKKSLCVCNMFFFPFQTTVWCRSRGISAKVFLIDYPLSEIVLNPCLLNCFQPFNCCISNEIIWWTQKITFVIYYFIFLHNYVHMWIIVKYECMCFTSLIYIIIELSYSIIPWCNLSFLNKVFA